MSRKLFQASCILMVLLFAVLAVSRYISSREIEAIMNGGGNEEVYRLATSVCTFLLNALNVCLFVWPFFALPLWLSGKENIAASLWDIAKTSSVGIIFAIALYFARLSFIGSGNIQRVITNGLTCLLVGLFVSLGLAAVISRRRQGKKIFNGGGRLISLILPTITVLSCAALLAIPRFSQSAAGTATDFDFLNILATMLFYSGLGCCLRLAFPRSHSFFNGTTSALAFVSLAVLVMLALAPLSALFGTPLRSYILWQAVGFAQTVAVLYVPLGFLAALPIGKDYSIQ